MHSAEIYFLNSLTELIYFYFSLFLYSDSMHREISVKKEWEDKPH